MLSFPTYCPAPLLNRFSAHFFVLFSSMSAAIVEHTDCICVIFPFLVNSNLQHNIFIQSEVFVYKHETVLPLQNAFTSISASITGV